MTTAETTIRLIHDVSRTVTLQLGSEPLLVYNYGSAHPKPFIHPLYAPRAEVITLARPHDHLHHRGLWFAWPRVNGINFWEEHSPPEQTGRVHHRRFREMAVDARRAVFAADNAWVTISGEHLLDEVQRFQVELPTDPDWRLVDIEIELAAQPEAVVLGTPPSYHGLGYRVARSMDRGQILNANGDEGPEATTGTRTTWCDYSGRLDGTGDWVGVAIFDHPANPRHPTPFFTMNQPFGFIAPALAYHEPYEIRRGQPLRLRYAVAIHRGRATREAIEQHYRAWTEKSA